MTLCRCDNQDGHCARTRMKRFLTTNVLLLFVSLGTGVHATAQTPSPTSPTQPIRVEISQPSQPHTSLERWTALLQSVAWPFVAIAALSLFRKPLSNFLEMVGKRASEISIGGLGIKLPTMNEAQLGDDVLTFRAADAFMVLSSSAKSSLFSMFEQSSNFEFVAINLGRGEKWLSSRLYIFAKMLQRMKALRCVVFLAPGPETETQFVGAASPEKVCWGLAMQQPWLEVAYAQAYAALTEAGPIWVQNENGAIEAAVGEQLVKNFIGKLTIPPTPPINDWEWVTFAPNQPPEHAVWLSRDYIEQALGYALWKDSIVASETKREAKSLMKCSAPYVARVKKNREFISLVDRTVFLDEVIAKISEKLGAAD